MQRVDSFGNTAVLPAEEAQVNPPGYFTVGNPSSFIPATVVPAWWCNQVQEELLAVILAAGITPSKTDYNQLLEALGIIGVGQQQATFTLANNQSSAANITGMIFDKTLYTMAEISADAYRKDNTPTERRALIKATAIYKPVLDTWELVGPSVEGETFENLGVDLSIIAATGQVQYTTTNFTGGSYVGELRWRVSRFRQTV